MGSSMNTGAAETSDAKSTSAAAIAREFDLAFHDLKEEPTNNGRLIHAPKFCSALHVNDPSFFFPKFFAYLRKLCTEHSTVMEAVGPMDDAFGKQLFWLDLFKKALSVSYAAAFAFCAAAAVHELNAVPNRVPEAATTAAAVIPALAKWGNSSLKKRETAVKRNRRITALMIMGAGLGIKHLKRICELEVAAAGADEEAVVPAVEASVEELLGKVEDYSREMKWIKEEVKKSTIFEHLG